MIGEGALLLSRQSPPLNATDPLQRPGLKPGHNELADWSVIERGLRCVLPALPAVLIMDFGWVRGWSGRVLGGCCGREVSPVRHRGWAVQFCGGESTLPRRRSLIHRLHGGSRHPDRLLAPLLRGAA